MQVLHGVLPPGCGITLTKVDWYSSEPDRTATPLRRFDPLRCRSSREWGLAVTYTGPEGAYEQIETGRSLDAVARGAGAKFLAWWFLSRAKPPLMPAPSTGQARAVDDRQRKSS